ncbi:P2X purinoceptor 7-like [Aquarana catesbeiana]|uniref:P2X purinoceptor 7-like n=1 Tax=Aquarana catesbeiana TaxID=8400 RepID=UPI003CC97EE3
MDNPAVEESSTLENPMPLTQEEKRRLLIKKIWARYPAPENDPAFPNNPTISSTSDGSSTEDTEVTETERIGNTNWCSCERCIKMPTQVESICCREVDAVDACIPEGHQCITQADTFLSQIVHHEHVRIANIAIHLDNIPIVDANNNRRLRKTAYRMFIAWIYGILGKGNRRVIPSCAVNAVRHVFPDPNGSYVGFLYSNDYDASEMAFY